MPGGWLEVKMCVLKGFSRLVMCLNVKDQFVSESFSFKNDCAEKCYFHPSEISAVNLL